MSNLLLIIVVCSNNIYNDFKTDSNNNIRYPCFGILRNTSRYLIEIGDSKMPRICYTMLGQGR